jgi:hypothetical protein
MRRTSMLAIAVVLAAVVGFLLGRGGGGRPETPPPAPEPVAAPTPPTEAVPAPPLDEKTREALKRIREHKGELRRMLDRAQGN